MSYPLLVYFSHFVDLFDFMCVLFKFECVLIDIYFLLPIFHFVKRLDLLLLLLWNARKYMRINLVDLDDLMNCFVLFSENCKDPYNCASLKLMVVIIVMPRFQLHRELH